MIPYCYPTGKQTLAKHIIVVNVLGPYFKINFKSVYACTIVDPIDN